MLALALTLTLTLTLARTPTLALALTLALTLAQGGDSLLDAVRACSPAMAVGKIPIQRDESTPEKLPKMFYSKLPPNGNPNPSPNLNQV